MWYGIFLGGGIAAYAPSIKLSSLFAPAFIAANQPKDMAVFTEDADTDNSGREDVTMYFSPAAALALRHHFPDARPCDKPNPARLTLAAGEPECWRILFP